MARIQIDEVEVCTVGDTHFICLAEIAVYSDSYGDEPDEVKLIARHWRNGPVDEAEIDLQRHMTGPYALFADAAWRAALEPDNMARLNAQFAPPPRDTFADIRHANNERL